MGRRWTIGVDEDVDEDEDEEVRGGEEGIQRNVRRTANKSYFLSAVCITVD